MSKPMVMVTRKNFLRGQEKGTLRGTRLKKRTHPYNGYCDSERLTFITVCFVVKNKVAPNSL